ncbi:ribosomal-protein-alanine N-acetyltransferase [Salmonella enterica subsp. enterica serovar Enteritidis str. 76-2651]|nr:ribosomal-protein-alanine N-acetyltransferase [Salmonella enterica subsp. enterica serovar Enteritidis str. 76-2651]
MNTISILSTTDLPAAWQIEQRAHAFPWSEKTFLRSTWVNGISTLS